MKNDKCDFFLFENFVNLHCDINFLSNGSLKLVMVMVILVRI